MSVNGVTSGSNVDYESYNAGAGATASGSKPEQLHISYTASPVQP